MKALAAAGVMFALSGGAQADVSFNAGRVGAADMAATAKFYEAAFGLKEVRRFDFPGGAEILMNFGDTVAAAQANKGAQVVVMHRASDDVKDTIPHLVLNVTDIAATAKAVTAAGGKMQGEPKEFGKSGVMIGMAIDPAGNLIEMIHARSRHAGGAWAPRCASPCRPTRLIRGRRPGLRPTA
jgi:predicted enzyme related to lactoylglutathione lyase